MRVSGLRFEQFLQDRPPTTGIGQALGNRRDRGPRQAECLDLRQVRPLQSVLLGLIDAAMGHQIAKPRLVAGEAKRIEEQLIERHAQRAVELRVGRRQSAALRRDRDASDDGVGPLLPIRPPLTIRNGTSLRQK